MAKHMLISYVGTRYTYIIDVRISAKFEYPTPPVIDKGSDRHNLIMERYMTMAIEIIMKRGQEQGKLEDCPRSPIETLLTTVANYDPRSGRV